MASNLMKLLMILISVGLTTSSIPNPAEGDGNSKNESATPPTEPGSPPEHQEHAVEGTTEPVNAGEAVQEPKAESVPDEVPVSETAPETVQDAAPAAADAAPGGADAAPAGAEAAEEKAKIEEESTNAQPQEEGTNKPEEHAPGEAPSDQVPPAEVALERPSTPLPGEAPAVSATNEPAPEVLAEVPEAPEETHSEVEEKPLPKLADTLRVPSDGKENLASSTPNSSAQGSSTGNPKEEKKHYTIRQHLRHPFHPEKNDKPKK